MKKVLSLFLSVLMVFSLTSVALATDDVATLKAYTYGGSEDMQEYKTSVETLTFTGYAAGINAVNSGVVWDVSAAGNGSVLAWLDDADGNGLYEAYITAGGKPIYANSNCSFLFEGYSKLESIKGMNYLKTDNVAFMESMFMNCSSLKSIDIQYFNTASVTTMKSMFENCKAMTTVIGLDKINTANVVLMNSMFYGCESLANLDLSNLNTGKVTDMSYMFFNCKNLSKCDFGYENIKNGTGFMEDGVLSKFNTYNVTDMSYMFSGCQSLAELNLSGFSTGGVKSVLKMFYGCSSLETLDLSNWNFVNLGGKNQAIYDFLNLCPELKNLYLYNIEGYNAEFYDFGKNYEGTSAVKIYTQDSSFEQYNLWKTVLKYMAGSTISYANIPAERAILTFTVPSGVSYYRVTEIGSDENDFVFSDETRSYKKNTKLMISLYGNYSEYTFYVDGVAKTIAEDEAIYIIVVDDAAIYAVGTGNSSDEVEDDDKETGDGQVATNFFGVFSIIIDKIIAFFKKLFKIG